MRSNSHWVGFIAIWRELSKMEERNIQRRIQIFTFKKKKIKHMKRKWESTNGHLFLGRKRRNKESGKKEGKKNETLEEYHAAKFHKVNEVFLWHRREAYPQYRPSLPSHLVSWENKERKNKNERGIKRRVMMKTTVSKYNEKEKKSRRNSFAPSSSTTNDPDSTTRDWPCCRFNTRTEKSKDKIGFTDRFLEKMRKSTRKTKGKQSQENKQIPEIMLLGRPKQSWR